MALYDWTAPQGINPDRNQPSEFHGVLIDGTGATRPLSTSVVARDRVYEARIVSLLRQIYGTQTGRALFREIEGCGWRTMAIRPRAEVSFPALDPNADSTGFSPNHIDLSPRKKVKEDRDDVRQLLNGNDDVDRIIRSGVGGGYDVEVHFTPGQFVDFLTAHKGRLAVDTAGAQPDEILLHEMVHGARQKRGLFNQVELDSDFDDSEEFIAILVANIYASETHRKIRVSEKEAVPDIRTSHHGFAVYRATEEAFLPEAADLNFEIDENFRLVSRFVDEQPEFANTLRTINCPFNPVRRYFELLEKRRNVETQRLSS